MSYIISTCSTVDMTKEALEKLDIRCIGFHFVVNGKSYTDDLYTSMSAKEFYGYIREGADTSTSQVSVGEYVDYFRELLLEGNDVLHICLSSGISNTVQSANAAAKMLQAEFPNRKLYIVDSLCASAGIGVFVTLLSQKRAEGMDIDSLYQWAKDNCRSVQHWFCSTDLTYYIKGGRVSKVSGVIGGIFEICPLLCVSPEGKLKPIAKVRTKKKVLTALADKMEQHAEGGNNYNGLCYISHSDCLEDAEFVRDLIFKRFRHVKEVPIFDIGTTIGCHTGTGTVALFFTSTDEREDSK
ncbi:MAG: DegV family protein [Ruminococcus sp.]|nr:DegV family protein [Ruminococcus sp.]